MSVSNRLALPFIDAAQSQKHVTHNEALAALDALVLLSVRQRGATAPPGAPAEGDRYLVGVGATDAFADRDGSLAAFDDGGWTFLAPRAGWRAYVEDDGLLLLFDGADWIDLGRSVRELQDLSLLGLGTTADASNPLSAKLNAALFAAKSTGEGGTGDLRFTLNKSAAGNTVSQLYETNWSGRAETGLTGDDHFHVKVSADGSTWREAIDIDPTTGRPSFPCGIGDGEARSFRNLLRNARFSVNQRGVSGTVTLAAGQYGHDGVKAGAAGATYTFAASGIDTQITITAGSLILPVVADLIAGGVYSVSNAGTSQARVWQGTGYTGSGAYAAAPFQTPSLTANAQTNVEFSTGTVLRPQIEAGGVSTAFERIGAALDLAHCLYYFQTLSINGMIGGSNNTTRLLVNQPFLIPMRGAPSFALTKTSFNNGTYEFQVGAIWPVCSSPSIAQLSVTNVGVHVLIDGFSGMTAGQTLYANASTQWGTLSAEI